MDKRGFAILRKLISDVEGAPFPNAVNNELYTMWYEHAKIIAQDALEFLDQYDPEHRIEVTMDF